MANFFFEDDWGIISFEHYKSSIGDWSQHFNKDATQINSELCIKCYRSNAIKTRQELVGTLFDMLPFEIFEYIIALRTQLLNLDDYNHYMFSFRENESKPNLLRYLRPNQEQKSRIESEKPTALVKDINTPLGNIKARAIYDNNMASQCYRDVGKAIEMGVGTLEGLKNYQTCVYKWMLWIADHSYMSCWNRLMETIIRKVLEFDRDIYYMSIDTNPNKFGDADKLLLAIDIVKDMRYLVEVYLPYTLLTRPPSFFKAREDSGIEIDSYYRTLYNIYQITRIHPISIYIPDVKEFEMAVYAHDYYYDTYQKHTRLRNGKIVIPKGENPDFYWIGDKYIRHFI